MRYKRKKEFSKIIFVLNTCIAISVVIFTCVAVALTHDTSALTYLIPAVFAEQATATGFYFWKARKENEIKLLKQYGKTAEKVIRKGEEYEN